MNETPKVHITGHFWWERWLVNSPHKGPVMWKVFPCQEVVMWWVMKLLYFPGIIICCDILLMPLWRGSLYYDNLAGPGKSHWEFDVLTWNFTNKILHYTCTFLCFQDSWNIVTMKYCTCHDSTAVVAYATFHCDNIGLIFRSTHRSSSCGIHIAFI